MKTAHLKFLFFQLFCLASQFVLDAFIDADHNVIAIHVGKRLCETQHTQKYIYGKVK